MPRLTSWELELNVILEASTILKATRAGPGELPPPSQCPVSSAALQGYGRDSHGVLKLPDTATLPLCRAKAVSCLLPLLTARETSSPRAPAVRLPRAQASESPMPSSSAIEHLLWGDFERQAFPGSYPSPRPSPVCFGASQLCSPRPWAYTG